MAGLLAITPPGVGSAFPAPLLMAVALLVLTRKLPPSYDRPFSG
jgi:hypothetical protein